MQKPKVIGITSFKKQAGVSTIAEAIMKYIIMHGNSCYVFKASEENLPFKVPKLDIRKEYQLDYLIVDLPKINPELLEHMELDALIVITLGEIDEKEKKYVESLYTSSRKSQKHPVVDLLINKVPMSLTEEDHMKYVQFHDFMWSGKQASTFLIRYAKDVSEIEIESFASTLIGKIEFTSESIHREAPSPLFNSWPEESAEPYSDNLISNLRPQMGLVGPALPVQSGLYNPSPNVLLDRLLVILEREQFHNHLTTDRLINILHEKSVAKEPLSSAYIGSFSKDFIKQLSSEISAWNDDELIENVTIYIRKMGEEVKNEIKDLDALFKRFMKICPKEYMTPEVLSFLNRINNPRLIKIVFDEFYDVFFEAVEILKKKEQPAQEA